MRSCFRLVAPDSGNRLQAADLLLHQLLGLGKALFELLLPLGKLLLQLVELLLLARHQLQLLLQCLFTRFELAFEHLQAVALGCQLLLDLLALPLPFLLELEQLLLLERLRLAFGVFEYAASLAFGFGDLLSSQASSGEIGDGKPRQQPHEAESDDYEHAHSPLLCGTTCLRWSWSGKQSSAVPAQQVSGGAELDRVTVGDSLPTSCFLLRRPQAGRPAIHRQSLSPFWLVCLQFARR
jgi:hypothetical protein